MESDREKHNEIFIIPPVTPWVLTGCQLLMCQQFRGNCNYLKHSSIHDPRGTQ